MPPSRLRSDVRGVFSRLARHPVRALLVVAAIVAGTAAVWFVQRGGGRLRVRAPAIDPVDAAVDLAPLPVSLLAVPVRVDLAPLVEAMERGLPRTWGNLEERIAIPGNDRLEVAFDLRRDSVRAAFQDSTARVSTRVSYRARAWYDPPVLPTVSASCGTGDGEAPPRLEVVLGGPVTLDRDWRLRSRVRVERISPVTQRDRDRCRMTVIRYDVTERVVSGARDFLEKETTTLDSLVAGIDLRPHFAEWWDVIARPIRLTDDVWLDFGGEGLVRGPIRGSGQTVETVLGLRARPRLVVGPEPIRAVRLLPPLDTGFLAPGFSVRVEARGEYREAGEILEQELGGREFSRGDQTVRLEHFEMSGIGGGRLALAVDLSGDVQGRVYLVGTPRFDPEDGRIGVPDLDFDVASERAIVEGAAWVARIGLAGVLRDAARWPAAPAVDWAREQVERGLNRDLSDQVSLQGSVADVEIVEVVAGRDALLVRADVRAEATLRVRSGREEEATVESGRNREGGAP